MSTFSSAWRSIFHHPLYVTLSTVTLGLGIGVCVSNFATVDALVLRPLLLPDLDRLAIGLALAVLVARAMASLLFGVTATDVVSLSVAVLVLLASALLACWIPARRAALVDPMTALRHR